MAFAYILVTVIVALEVPLAINLDKRAQAEVETQNLLSAQTIAEMVGAEGMTPALQKFVYRKFAHTENGRVIVILPNGRLIADSTGSTFLGQDYATAARPELGQVLATHAPWAQTRFSNTLHQEIMVAAAPIIDEGSFAGVVRLSKSMADVQEQVRRTIIGLIVIGLAGLAAGLVIAFALAGSFSRPLTRLAAAARRLGGGDLSARAGPTAGAKEIVELGGSFDEMAGRLEATVKAQREFVANASHQLRTPLTGMKLRLESAIDATADEEVRRQLEAADKEVDRLADIVERLLVMARRIEEGGPAEIDLGEATSRAVERWGERASRLGATITATGEGGRALGEAGDLDQILDNLIDNAISHAPGPIVIETGRRDGRMFVAVEDRGPGIPREERHRVTDRFFRGKGAPPGGSGLGLAIVRDLAEKWGGSVAVDAPAEGKGTRVEVRLRATS